MAKGENQKLKMLYLTKIFMEETDAEHPLSLADIAERLRRFGVNADRKTLYLDFVELGRFGLDIERRKIGRSTGYYLDGRLFELAELKMLVDSVQAAKFITDERSKVLIRKLESLASRYAAKQLDRQVVIAGRVKTMNKTVYYNVDAIHEAISRDRQITFHYFQWNVRGEAVLRHGGALYQVSPWCLMWDDEYYYLVAYDAAADMIKHYRVDKMKDLTVCERARLGAEAFSKFDVARYTKSLFGMYGGSETRVTMECRNDLAGVIIDRFGKDVMLSPKDKDHFTVHVNVIPSSQFFGWVFALGGGAVVTGPKDVVDRMKEEVGRLRDCYLGDQA